MPELRLGFWNAWLFMSVFIIQMLAIAVINKRAWERSHVSDEARINAFERSISRIANFFWLLALGYSVFLPLQLGTIWFSIGLTIFILGLVFLGTATYSFVSTPTDEIITGGVYQLSRHPMYLGTFLICLGSGIAAGSWLFIFLTIVMALCFYQEAQIEERSCLKIYGTAYQDYMYRTRRCFGLPKILKKGEGGSQE